MVKGRVEESGSAWSGREYRAEDPELLLWVHATLVDTAMRVFEEVVRPFRAGEAEGYWEESKRFGEMFGIRGVVMLKRLGDFREYFDGMVSGDVLAVGEVARGQCRDIARFKPSDSFASIYGEAWGRRWGAAIDRPALQRTFTWATHRLAAGMLPARLREAYGYRWGRSERASYEMLVGVARVATKTLPPGLRFWPGYRDAVLRAG